MDGKEWEEGFFKPFHITQNNYFNPSVKDLGFHWTNKYTGTRI